MRFADILMTAATGAGGRDRDLELWMAAVVTNGGTVSAARAAIVGRFIGAEKDSGAWALTDDYWGLWAENEAQALTSLKQRRLATAVNTPTFTADRDYTFDATTNYIDTGFIAATHAVSMSTNSVHAELYERTNLTGNGTALGVNSAANRIIRINSRNAGNANGFANSASATYTLPAANSQGLTQVGRSGALATDAYGAKNGVDMTRTVDPSGVGTSLPPTYSLYIGGVNTTGSYSSNRAASVGYVAIGAALTDTQRLARYNNVQAWATSVGAQV